MQARVLEILLDMYKVSILNHDKEVLVKIRGSVKKKNRIKVGDNVLISKINDEYIITELLQRKNEFIRPPVSNVDYVFIVISAGSPKPDFLLLDKQIITAEYYKSFPIIVINKMDLDKSDEIYDYVKNIYGSLGYPVIATNTIGNKLLNEDLFRDIPAGCLCAFSGNSGVGKSSIISKIKETSELLDINGVSSKTGRGRHTTKKVTIYNVKNNDGKKIYFLDTPGFSSFEVFNIPSKELKYYYKEFSNYTCDYDDCMHINEDQKCCKVKEALISGKIDKLRYEHYVKIYDEIVMKEKRMYK